MTGKITLAVHDNVHNQNAQGLEYDLWRIHNNTNRVNIRHDSLTNDIQHVLLEVNTAEELGSYEIIFYIDDYFKRFNENIVVPNNRLIVPFGTDELNENYHLNLHITPTGYSCTF